MALRRRLSGGTWGTPTIVRIRNSNGTWRDAAFIRRRLSNGTWQTEWTSALTCTPASVSAGAPRGSGTRSVAVTLSKAVTGAWLSGGASISVSGSGTAFTFSSVAPPAGAADVTRTGTYRFTASDGSGQTVDVPVTFTFFGNL